jgi:hypothetical protein
MHLAASNEHKPIMFSYMHLLHVVNHYCANKKGHAKYMEEKNAPVVHVEDENGDVDNPAILQVLLCPQ